MPTLVACLRRSVEGMWPRRVPTRFGPGTRLRRPKNQWNQGPLATPQAEMCPRTANSGLLVALPALSGLAALLLLGGTSLPQLAIALLAALLVAILLAERRLRALEHLAARLERL